MQSMANPSKSSHSAQIGMVPTTVYPAVPSFSNFQFKTIGQPPDLLKRMNATADGDVDMYESQEEDSQEAEPGHTNPLDEFSNTSPGSKQRSFYERLGLDVDADMTADASNISVPVNGEKVNPVSVNGSVPRRTSGESIARSPSTSPLSGTSKTVAVGGPINTSVESRERTLSNYMRMKKAGAHNTLQPSQPRTTSDAPHAGPRISRDGSPESTFGPLRAAHQELTVSFANLDPIASLAARPLAQNLIDRSVELTASAKHAYALAQKAVAATELSVTAAQKCIALAETFQCTANDVVTALAQTDDQINTWNARLQTYSHGLNNLSGLITLAEESERQRRDYAVQQAIGPLNTRPALSTSTPGTSQRQLPVSTPDQPSAMDHQPIANAEEVTRAIRKQQEAEYRRRAAAEELRKHRETEERLERQQAESLAALAAARNERIEAERAELARREREEEELAFLQQQKEALERKANEERALKLEEERRAMLIRQEEEKRIEIQRKQMEGERARHEAQLRHEQDLKRQEIATQKQRAHTDEAKRIISERAKLKQSPPLANTPPTKPSMLPPNPDSLTLGHNATQFSRVDSQSSKASTDQKMDEAHCSTQSIPAPGYSDKSVVARSTTRTTEPIASLNGQQGMNAGSSFSHAIHPQIPSAPVGTLADTKQHDASSRTISGVNVPENTTGTSRRMENVQVKVQQQPVSSMASETRSYNRAALPSRDTIGPGSAVQKMPPFAAVEKQGEHAEAQRDQSVHIKTEEEDDKPLDKVEHGFNPRTSSTNNPDHRKEPSSELPKSCRETQSPPLMYPPAPVAPTQPSNGVVYSDADGPKIRVPQDSKEVSAADSIVKQGSSIPTSLASKTVIAVAKSHPLASASSNPGTDGVDPAALTSIPNNIPRSISRNLPHFECFAGDLPARMGPDPIAVDGWAPGSNTEDRHLPVPSEHRRVRTRSPPRNTRQHDHWSPPGDRPQKRLPSRGDHYSPRSPVYSPPGSPQWLPRSPYSARSPSPTMAYGHFPQDRYMASHPELQGTGQQNNSRLVTPERERASRHHTNNYEQNNFKRKRPYLNDQTSELPKRRQRTDSRETGPSYATNHTAQHSRSPTPESLRNNVPLQLRLNSRPDSGAHRAPPYAPNHRPNNPPFPSKQRSEHQQHDRGQGLGHRMAPNPRTYAAQTESDSAPALLNRFSDATPLHPESNNYTAYPGPMRGRGRGYGRGGGSLGSHRLGKKIPLMNRMDQSGADE